MQRCGILRFDKPIGLLGRLLLNRLQRQPYNPLDQLIKTVYRRIWHS